MRLAVAIIAVAALHVFLLWMIFFRPATEDVFVPDDKERTEETVEENDEETVKPGRQKDFSGFSQPETELSGEVASKAEDCRTGVLIDWSNQRILWEKEADKTVPIASMVKMMTALLVMETIEDDPAVSLNTEVDVSERAAQVQGRQVWLDPRETFSLDDLLKMIMIHSANDAAYLAAEFIGDGDADAFVERMNQRGEDLGFGGAKFVNPHGLDGGREETANRATAREIAWLTSLLLDYPRVVHWASTWFETIREDDPRFNRFDLVNTNRLVRAYEGVDGMKTGYTSLAGFCLAATVQRDGRRLIAVVTGCSSQNSRNDLVTALFDWGWEQ